jgi:hypothetical protein
MYERQLNTNYSKLLPDYMAIIQKPASHLQIQSGYKMGTDIISVVCCAVAETISFKFSDKGILI